MGRSSSVRPTIPITLPCLIAAGATGTGFLITLLFVRETRRARPAEAARVPVKAVLSDPTTARLLAIHFAVYLIFTGAEGVFALWVKMSFGLGARDIGYYLAFAGDRGAVVQGGLVGRIVRRIGEPATIGLAILCLSLGVVLLPFAPARDDLCAHGADVPGIEPAHAVPAEPAEPGRAGGLEGRRPGHGAVGREPGPDRRAGRGWGHVHRHPRIALPAGRGAVGAGVAVRLQPDVPAPGLRSGGFRTARRRPSAYRPAHSLAAGRTDPWGGIAPRSRRPPR